MFTEEQAQQLEQNFGKILIFLDPIIVNGMNFIETRIMGALLYQNAHFNDSLGSFYRVK